MSLSMILVPMAVAVCVSSAETILAVKEKCSNPRKKDIDDIETRFADADILHSTLKEHGVNTIIHNKNNVEAIFEAGRITYHKNPNDENFKMRISNVTNIDGLICDLDLIENEYDLNLQSYTYNSVINNLPENMSVENEEVLEDDSILITVNVD